MVGCGLSPGKYFSLSSTCLKEHLACNHKRFFSCNDQSWNKRTFNLLIYMIKREAGHASMFNQFHDDWNAQKKMCVDHLSAMVWMSIFNAKGTDTQKFKATKNKQTDKTHICADNLLSFSLVNYQDVCDAGCTMGSGAELTSEIIIIRIEPWLEGKAASCILGVH